MAILIKNVRIMQTEAPFEVKENMDVLIDNGIIRCFHDNIYLGMGAVGSSDLKSNINSRFSD